jgi:4'-phosphopantetheinyl transferase EntD
MDVENTQAPQDDSDLVPHINSPAELGLLDQTDSAASQQEATGPTFTHQ